MNNPNMLNTYLGQKGYTVFKKELSPEQHNFIKTELTAKPYTPGAPGTNTQSNTFPVYRESSQKYYMPRYFGEAHFGPAKDCRIPEGVDIDIKFAGELRDNQKPVVTTYLDQVQKNGNTGGGLLELPCAMGKTVIGLNLISQLKKKTHK